MVIAAFTANERAWLIEGGPFISSTQEGRKKDNRKTLLAGSVGLQKKNKKTKKQARRLVIVSWVVHFYTYGKPADSSTSSIPKKLRDFLDF